MPDKKNFISLLLVLILGGWAFKAYAQTAKRNYTIGDTCRDFEMELINSKEKLARLSDFRGKALILDFWATWCSPCVELLPKMQKLQHEFEGKLKILPVTTEDEHTVKNFLNKMQHAIGVNQMSAINSTALSQAFKHRTIPHYVWIDEDGVVRAVTSYEQVNPVNINAFINKQPLDLPIKDEVRSLKYDKDVPLFLQKDFAIKDNDLVRYSVLTKYIPGLGMTTGGNRRKIMITNLSVLALFKYAYSAGNYKYVSGNSLVELDSKDSLKYTYGTGWSREQKETWHLENCYCYDLMVPEKDAASRFAIMQKDLENYFPLTASYVKKKKKCLIITTTGKNEKYRSNGGDTKRESNAFSLKYTNVSIDYLVFDLFQVYQYQERQILNETGYRGKIDIEVNAQLSNIKELSRELQKWGLEIKEEEREFDVLLIKDKETPPQKNLASGSK